MKLSELAKDLKPYLLPWVREAAGSVTVGTGGLSAHALNGPYHTGLLGESQAPWAVTDSEFSAHTSNANAHHNRQHDIVSASDHTITGAALSLVGATALNTLGLITPSNNPGTTEAVLKATSGLLTLPSFTATTKVTTPHAGSPSTFTSGFTGAGYRLDDGLATAGKTTLEIDEMIVRGRMRVYELLIHQIRATNGSVFVTGVGKAKTVTGSGPYTITTETDHGFAANDLIRAQRFTGSGVYQSNLQVTSVATTAEFTATLSSGDAPAAGMEFVRLGNTTDSTRQGSIYLTADDTFAPAIDILDGVTSFAEWGAASKLKARVGKLTTDLDANLLPTGYGLYSKNVYLSGDLLTGAGAIRIYNASGINIAQDVWGSWDNKRAVQWWPDVASMTGSPSLSIYTGKAVGGLTDQQNFSYIDANPTGGQLAGLSLTAFGQGTGGLATVYLEGGSQALATNPSITLTASTIDLVGTPVLSGTASAQHFYPKVDVTYNLGSAVLRWGTLYVNQIVAGSISGTTMSGAEWEYLGGNMVIDANSGAGNTTVSVVNQGAGAWVANLAVEGVITSGGTAVSLAGHNHNDLYYTEGESDARYVQTATLGNYVLKAGDTMTGDLAIEKSAATNINLRTAGNTAATAARFILYRSRGTIGAETATQSGDMIGGIAYRGYDGSAYATNDNAVIRAYASETFTASAQGTNLRFYTTVIGASSPTERVRIHNSGNVSVGNTTDAGHALDVTGTGRVSGLLTASGGIAATGSVTASTSLIAPTVTTAAGNLSLTSAGGTVAITGAVTGSSTATFAGAVTTPTINTASGNLSVAPAGGTTAFTGAISLTGLLSAGSWSITGVGIATFAVVSAPSGVYTNLLTTASGNLSISPAGGTTSVAGALVGNSTAAFTTSVSAPLFTAGSGDVTVSAPGSLYLNGAAAVGLWVAGSEVAAVNTERIMPAGSGLKDLGDYNRRWRSIHAEDLAVQTLVAQNVIATIGGDLIVTPTTKLIADITSAAGGIGQSALYTNLAAFWRLEETSGIRYDAKGSSTLGEQGTMASTTGKVGTAASFNGSSFLYASDSATLSVGDIDFYISGWVYIGNDTGSNRYIAFKGIDGSSSRAWALYLNGAVGAQRARFQVWNTGMGSNATVTASTFGNLSINTWYFVEAWHDATANQIGVAVNRTENTTAWSNGVNDDTGDFKLGALGFSNYFTGAIDEFGFWKNYIPSSTDRNWLYNSGAGRTFSNIYLYGVTDINVDVEHNNLRSGEWILLKTAPGGIQQTEKMLITSAATTITGGYRYTASRDQDGTGPNNWYIGDAVASQQKNAGEGYLWLTATSTPHGHTGPGMIGYVRTGGLVNDVKPVFVKGNLRSFVDYASDEYGDGAGNDLALTPTSGFKGYTIDRTNGMRLFNTDLRLYSGATKIIGLDTARGLDIELDSADGDSNRAISYRSAGVTYNWLKGYNTGGWQYIKLASEPITGLNNAVVLRTSAAATKESSIFLSTTNADGSTTTNYVYLHHKTDGSGELELSSGAITLFGPVVTNSTLAVGTTIKTGLNVPWNLGGYTAGAPAATGYLTAIVNGVTYKLLAST